MKTKLPPTDPDAFIKEAIDIKAAELEVAVRQMLIERVDNALHKAVLMGDVKPQKPSHKKRKK